MFIVFTRTDNTIYWYRRKSVVQAATDQNIDVLLTFYTNFDDRVECDFA